MCYYIYLYITIYYIQYVIINIKVIFPFCAFVLCGAADYY